MAYAGHISLDQLKVMSAIETFRTAALGGHVEACEDCGHTRIAYNSCRNRHCPKCQGAAAREWLAEREADLLPVGYFHVVFTVPAEIAAIAVEALRAAGLKTFSLRIGDLALFNALVDALALPANWRGRLKRHFWRPGYVESLLHWLGHGDARAGLPKTRGEIEALIDAQGDAPPAGRTRAEIVARALDRAAQADSPTC